VTGKMPAPTILGEDLRAGDLLGSDHWPIKKIFPVLNDPDLRSHCAYPPAPPPGNGLCGCYSPASRLEQLPRSIAVGPHGERTILLHHLPHIAHHATN